MIVRFAPFRCDLRTQFKSSPIDFRRDLQWFNDEAELVDDIHLTIKFIHLLQIFQEFSSDRLEIPAHIE